jgi:ABC-2 type transport system permease protein
VITSTPVTSPLQLRPWNLTSAFLRRDWAIALSYRFPFLSSIAGSLSSLVLFYFIAKLVDRGVDPLVPELGAGYFAFVMVGSAVMLIVEQSLTSYSTQISSAQRAGTLEAMAATPAPLWLTTLLGSLYDLLFATATSACMITLGVVAFGVRFDIAPGGVPILVVGLAATVLLFSSLGMLAAAFALVFKRTGPLLQAVSTVIAFASGVWFPLQLLPRPLEIAANLLPFTWAVDSLRLTVLAGARPVLQCTVLAISAAALLPLSLVVFHRAARRTRRDGTLGFY